MGRADVAPRLHTINYNGEYYASVLLASRPIERICVNAFNHPTLEVEVWSLHNDIVRSPGTLTHLLMLGVYRWILDGTERDPTPYRNLKFVGTINIYIYEEDGMTTEMHALQSLNALEAIEIDTNPWYGDQYMLENRVSEQLFSPGCSFLGLIEERHPFLRRVILSTRHLIRRDSPKDALSTLWEKRGTWTSTMVPYLEYWDILCGSLDKL